MKTNDSNKAGETTPFNLATSQEEIQKVIQNIAEIKKKHPELLKYLDEMPDPGITDDHPEVRLRDLKAYNAALLQLVAKYELDK